MCKLNSVVCTCECVKDRKMKTANTDSVCERKRQKMDTDSVSAQTSSLE